MLRARLLTSTKGVSTMWRKTATGLAVGAAALTLAVPASAAPKKGQVFAAKCNGKPVTLLTSGGATFWVGDAHYVLVSLTLTFGGESETKTYGQKRGLTQRIRCTGGEDGFRFEAIGARVPA
jgi:hypothetical protein